MKKLILIPLIFLSACAGVGKTDCYKRVASSEIAITESYETTTRLLLSGMIDKPTARKAMKATDGANALATSAKTLCSIDEPKAGQYLLEAASLLLEANTILGE